MEKHDLLVPLKEFVFITNGELKMSRLDLV